MDLGLHHRASLALLAGLAVVVYWLGLVAYRLLFHPLARFPGPKLAAATSWYEAYYEIAKGGQFSKKISQLHHRYGPILRITPDEIHIRDTRFFDTLYPAGVHLNKYGWDKRFGSPDGLLMTVDAAEHKRRRAAVIPMFSRRSILDFLHIIHGHIDTLAVRLDEFQKRKEPINLTLLFPALTGDIIMDYFFGFNQGHLKNPEFESFHAAFMSMGPTGHIATQWPGFLRLMEMIPEWLVFKLSPEARPLFQFRSQNKHLIQETLKGTDLKTNSAKKTIFHEILQSKHLPDSDKSQKRLEDEALVVLAGGVETTAYALVIACYHIIANRAIYTRLHAHLVAAIPNRAAPLDLQTLENLPYLKACILEAVRLSYGLSARNPRTHSQPLQYKEWTIPPGTCTSMSIPDVNHDEEFFPNSNEYIPERWLGPDSVGLEKYMVSFGRGTRSCLGMNLAFTELYLVLGAMFRNYSYTLFETDVTDVQMAHDYFVPHVRKDSKGVRAFVEATTD